MSCYSNKLLGSVGLQVRIRRVARITRLERQMNETLVQRREPANFMIHPFAV